MCPCYPNTLGCTTVRGGWPYTTFVRYTTCPLLLQIFGALWVVPREIRAVCFHREDSCVLGGKFRSGNSSYKTSKHEAV